MFLKLFKFSVIYVYTNILLTWFYLVFYNPRNIYILYFPSNDMPFKALNNKEEEKTEHSYIYSHTHTQLST